MKFLTLDGGEYKNSLKTNIQENKSSHHLKVREFLKKTFPTVQKVEELPIKIKRGTVLYLDFYIPLYKIACEIDGPQHYSYSHFLHKNRLNFINSQKNDRLKEEFCELNKIRLVRLRYDESEEEWRQKLIG